MGTYTPISSAGKKLYISATPSGSATLEIKGVTVIPGVGPKAQKSDRTTLRDTSMRKGKSALNDNGTLQIRGLRSNQDAGQQMLVTAQASASTYNFKIEYADAAALGLTNNSTDTFAGLVMDFIGGGGAINKDEEFTCTIEIDGAITGTLPS